ncbi:MAG TPA: M13 family metallopeptidase [Thermoanaerobaculia bacterium]|nr:M13 family metallopeptidase [Thermoanaerobaculia bacterium]
MTMKRRAVCLVAIAWQLSGCQHYVASSKQTGTAPVVATSTWDEPSMTRYGRWGVDLDAMDTRVSPGDDFYRYAVGKWIDKTRLGADEIAVSSEYAAKVRTGARVRDLIQHASAADESPGTRILGSFYRSFMDTTAIERRDDATLKRDLQTIRALQSKEALAEWMGANQDVFARALFPGEPSTDRRDPTRYVYALYQGGLGMGSRDYYLDSKFETHRAAYVEYMRELLSLAGWAHTDQTAQDIMAMEKRIAGASWTAAESRDFAKTTNYLSIADLDTLAPGFPWPAFLRGEGLSINRVLVNQVTAFPALAQVFAETPLETLKAWEVTAWVDQAAPFLPQRFADARFKFREKVMEGRETPVPRSERAIDVLNSEVGELVGLEYMNRYFPASSRAKVEAIVEDLRAAMAVRIRGLEWMTAPTKQQALEKLDRLRVLIGGPTTLRDFSTMRITEDDVYANVVEARKLEMAYQKTRLGQPVDRGEFQLHAHDVDAYANATRVVIGLPAGILQPPYFDPLADPAVNYGALGSVIGHEITHLFDDQGRKRDATGALRDWWTAEDAAKFERAAAQMVRQYEDVEVLPGVHGNGQLTLGENIADLGGLLLALDAYHRSQGGRTATILDGFTGDQRLFLARAQLYRGKARNEHIQAEALRNPHATKNFRAVGPARNVDLWYETFAVRPGQREYLPPEKRIRIW